MLQTSKVHAGDPNSDCRKLIGIDIGGAKIAVAAVDDSGVIMAKTVIQTRRESSFREAMSQISAAAKHVIAKALWDPEELVAIGVGSAAQIDPETGAVTSPYPCPAWKGCRLAKALRDRLDIPVHVESDADAAGLAEQLVGAGRGFNPVLMLTFGTGIGGAFLVNNRIYRGCAGQHPEIGHVPFNPKGPECYCGQNGCFESVASGSAIERAGRAIGLRSCREVFLAAANGDPKAKEIVDEACSATSVAIKTILRTFLPERIILGGGLIEKHYELFAEAARTSLRSSELVPSSITVAKGQLGSDAGVVGAALAAIRGPKVPSTLSLVRGNR
ncbi:MAG: ROK family protein [Verrucomicrobia bacterium]|nr:ROK family protein [Verrucomicrobiota bacterium]